MKNIYLKLTILVSVMCYTFHTNAQEKISIASYNVRYANQNDFNNGNGWEQRCPVICKLIQFHDFEIFGAQEVLVNQLEDLSAGLPHYSHIGVGRDDGKQSGEYAPIFYKTERFNLLKSGHFWLSPNTDYPNKGWDAALPRICTWGQFEDKKTGFRFWFFNLHMDHIGVEARVHSGELVLNKIKEMCSNEAVILTGDFNVDQTHGSYELLNSSGILRDAYTISKLVYATNGTFNDFDTELKTDSRIDHIFVSSGFTVEKYGVLTDTYRSKKNDEKKIQSANFPKEVSLTEYKSRVPSDHFPVQVILSYNK